MATLKDSGERMQFGKDGAERDGECGKGRYDLLSPLANHRLALWMEAGASKYNDRNWEKGMPLSEFVDSMQRHLQKLLCGLEDEDHLAALLWNAHGLVHTATAVSLGLLPADLDDLPHYFEDVEQGETFFEPRGWIREIARGSGAEDAIATPQTIAASAESAGSGEKPAIPESVLAIDEVDQCGCGGAKRSGENTCLSCFIESHGITRHDHVESDESAESAGSGEEPEPEGDGGDDDEKPPHERYPNAYNACACGNMKSNSAQQCQACRAEARQERRKKRSREGSESDEVDGPSGVVNPADYVRCEGGSPDCLGWRTKRSQSGMCRECKKSARNGEFPPHKMRPWDYDTCQCGDVKSKKAEQCRECRTNKNKGEAEENGRHGSVGRCRNRTGLPKPNQEGAPKPKKDGTPKPNQEGGDGGFDPWCGICETRYEMVPGKPDVRFRCPECAFEFMMDYSDWEAAAVFDDNRPDAQEIKRRIDVTEQVRKWNIEQANAEVEAAGAIL